MRLAYFSPLPPTHSGIADYSSELLPYLAERAEITLVVDQPDVVSDSLRGMIDIITMVEYPNRRLNFDMALYHMGNNVHHADIYRFALRYPGVVVLHDFFLHHFIGSISLVKGDRASYIRELAYAMDTEGLNIYRDIRLGRRRRPVFEVSLANRIVDRSIGILVHNQAAAAEIHALRPDRATRIVPSQVTVYDGKSSRENLDVSNKTIIFTSLGFVNSTKHIELALREFALLKEDVPDIHYLIVGGIQGSIDLDGQVRDLGLEGFVTQTGYVDSLQTFVDWVETADVVINLRYPTLGETSGAALRAMAAGKPTIVFDHGWYSELPDDACIKVPPLDRDALLSAMTKMARDPAARRQMGQYARSVARQVHDPGSAAAGYIEFLNDCLDDIKRRTNRRKVDAFRLRG